MVAKTPLRTVEITLENDYGMIDGIISNGCRWEELEKNRMKLAGPRPL